MGTRKRREAEYNDTLRKLGFGLEHPPDDYSDQPSSSGRIGGVRGQQEYGIEGGVAQERHTEAGDEPANDPQLLDSVEAASETLSDFSEEAGRAEERKDENDEERAALKERPVPGDLKSLIQDRLDHNHYIDSASITVDVEPSGLVILSGRVRTEAESLRASEITASLPGVLAIDNKLQIDRSL